MYSTALPFAMSKVITKEPPKLKPVLDPVIMTAIDQDTLTESNVYVHCYFQNEWKDALVRVWKTTFLVDQATGSKSRMLHAENISIAPLWTLIADNATHDFLLIFEALPKGCTHFDLVEEISQPGGFHVTNIPRNKQDVYHVDL